MKYRILPVFLLLIYSCKKEVCIPISMKEDVEILASDVFQGRQTGTKGEKKAASYIAKRMRDVGLSPKGTNNYFQPFTFTPKTNPHQKIDFTIKNGDSVVRAINVIGFLDNSAKNTIVIGAHYDHLGYGGEGSLYRGEKAIHNGADDNASGVAVLLNLAKKLNGKNTANNYLFIAFTGEEMGLLGSNYFVKNPTVKLETINYMINMDMVGRLKKDSTLAVYGVGTSPIFKQTLQSHNSNFKLITKSSGVGPSDHTSFYNANIPVLHFFTGQHEDYHKPSDDFEKLNYQGMQSLSNYIFELISDLNDNDKLAFKTTKNESDAAPRFKVTLGVVPDYLYNGKGMRIDGVSEDKPAQKAGLLKGDVVVKLGAITVKDMQSYMLALSQFEKGNTTTVVVDRKGTLVSKKITF